MQCADRLKTATLARSLKFQDIPGKISTNIEENKIQFQHFSLQLLRYGHSLNTLKIKTVASEFNRKNYLVIRV